MENKALEPAGIVPEVVQLRDRGDETKYLRHLLLGMVEQHCHAKLARSGKKYDSGFVTVNAEVIRYLCEVGLLKMLSDDFGRCVWACDLDLVEQAGAETPERVVDKLKKLEP